MEKGVDTLAKSFRVLLRRQVMEKTAHGVETDGLCPAKLEINALGIEGIRLPHFEFIDCIRGNVVAPHQPRLLSIPIFGGLLLPPRVLRAARPLNGEKITKHHQEPHDSLS